MENIWAIQETGEKRDFVLEPTITFVCTERVFMHYLETTFLKEADVSTVGHQKEEIKSMKHSLTILFLKHDLRKCRRVRFYNYFSFAFIYFY